MNLKAFEVIFQVGINIKPTKQRDGGIGGEKKGGGVGGRSSIQTLWNGCGPVATWAG